MKIEQTTKQTPVEPEPPKPNITEPISVEQPK